MLLPDGQTPACFQPEIFAFARLLAQNIRLRAQYPEYPVNGITLYSMLLHDLAYAQMLIIKFVSARPTT
jgi:hypothetical protein